MNCSKFLILALNFDSTARVMGFSVILLLGELWKNWDVQLFVMLSLSLQLFLIWFAALRKRVSSQILQILIWLAYLMADWAAAFTIGLIHYQGNNEKGDGNLYSFWAPFLILHMGGPDTITAFSMEDNELWRRHMLRFIAQTVATGNIIYHKPPPNIWLWLPTIMVFVCGLIRFGERVFALYCGCMDKFRRSILRDPDPGPNYAMFMEQYAQMVEEGYPTRIEIIEEPELEQDLQNFEVRQKGQLQGKQVVKDAYHFYQRFKGLIVDFEYGFRERNKCVQYFLSLQEDDAFRVVETELNFVYDAFYTKAAILHHGKGYFTRFFCLSLVLISFGVFYVWDKVDNKSNRVIQSRDIKISYALLLGAITLDAISILMLLSSKWSVAFLVKDYESKEPTFSNKVAEKMLAFKTRWLSAFPEAPATSQFMFRQWSKSVSRISLLNYYLQQRHPKFNKLLDSLGLRLLFDGITYVDTSMVNQNMRKLILGELKQKSNSADDPQKIKNLCSARGEWVLYSYGVEEVLELRNWIVEVEYDESLLLWHIATELCYNIDRRYDEERNMSKALSDYMVYLLVMKPLMISNVAGISDLRLRDTEAEALRFLRVAVLDPKDPSTIFQPLDLLCQRMMSVSMMDVRPKDVKGTRSKSVLFEACRLAKRLLNMPKEVNRWEVMSRVWVEMLSYAASHCRPPNHVQQLSRGGELISVVWLLMTHLGLGEQFHLEDGPTRTKLIVGD